MAQNPEFARRLAALIAASDPDGPGPRPPRIQMGSLSRSYAEQVAIARKAQAKHGANWTKWAAKPGTSKHGDYGTGSVANDLKGDLALAKRLAPQFGLHFPMGHEPWHIELAGQVATARNASTAPATTRSAVAAPRPAAPAPAPEVPVDPAFSGHQNVTFGIDGKPITPGAAPAPAPANPSPTPQPAVSLATDPAYLAFLRALGVEDSEDAASTQTGVDRINRTLAARLPEVTEAGDYAREGISGSFESRGLFRSGSHEVALARQRAAEGRTISDLESTTADSTADLTTALARRRAERERRKAEATLAGAGNVYGDDFR